MSGASPSSGRDRTPHARARPKDKTTFRRETRVGLTLRAAAVSLLLLGLFIGAWHLATLGVGSAVSMDPEYAKLVGASATQGKSAMPGPADVGAKVWEHLRNPFYDRGSND